ISQTVASLVLKPCSRWFFSGPCSFLNEVVGVNLFHLVRSGHGDSYVVVDHVFGKCYAVNEDDLAVDPGCEFESISRKRRGGNKHALTGAMSLKCSCKLLNLRTTHSRIPPLCLDVDHVEAKPIFLDDPIDSSVAASPHCLSGISQSAAVA